MVSFFHNSIRWRCSKLRKPIRICGLIDQIKPQSAASALGLGIVGRLLIAGGIITLLWIAAAWAMG